MEIELYIYLLGFLFTLGRHISESEKQFKSKLEFLPCIASGLCCSVFWPFWIGYLGVFEK